MTDYLSATATTVVCSLLGGAAWRDVATRTIPNGFSLAIAAVGVACRLTEGVHAALASLAAAVVLFVCLVPLNIRGLLGGADIKLLSALSLGLPPLAALHLLNLVALFGAILALTYLALGRLLRRRPVVRGLRRRGVLARLAAIERYRIGKSIPLPYGVAIAAGGVAFAFGNSGI